MKRIYFVRHGESEANKNKTHGHSNVLLTAKGEEQAAYVAERCSLLPIEAVVASIMTRAQQTAKAISQKINLPVESSDLFVELAGLSKFYDLPHDDVEAKQAYDELTKNFAPGYRFGDEENFDDIKERAEKALRFLAAKDESHILVVSHGLFLRVLAASAVFGPELSARECRGFMDGFDIKNTGLTVFEYEPIRSDSTIARQAWRIWVWNDHAHLG